MTASKERISALMDNEQLYDQSVQSALKDSEAQDTWERYHIIRDVLHNDLPAQFDLDLSAKIAAAIEQEPTILAPKTERATTNPVKTSRIVRLPQKAGRVLHWAGQYGIAASVAVAVLAGVQHYQSSQTEPALNNQLTTIPVGGGASPVSVNYTTEPVHLLQKKQSLSEEEVQAQRLRIARFIQDHQLQQRLSQRER